MLTKFFSVLVKSDYSNLLKTDSLSSLLTVSDLTSIRMIMQPIYIVNGVRSGFGRLGGSLRDANETELLSTILAEALERSMVAPTEISQHIMGTVVPTNGQSAYLARHSGLKAGLSLRSSALAVNRLCGSGLESVAQGAMALMLGQSTGAVICSGIELMSKIPYLSAGLRWGVRMGHEQLEDALQSALTDTYAGINMGQTAENLAKDFDISREEQDEWALRSQSRAEQAKSFLAGEILSLGVIVDGKEAEFRSDEGIRGQAVESKLPNMRAAFETDGTVTAGNSSGINDGASAVVLATEDFVSKKNLKPLAKIRGFGVAGCRPDRMGMGPSYSLPVALKNSNLALDDLEIVEINEAFAAQVLAVLRETPISKDKVNLRGGAIALGHPLGASGNRLILTLTRQLHEDNKQIGAATLCIGGGQGIAMVIERV